MMMVMMMSMVQTKKYVDDHGDNVGDGDGGRDMMMMWSMTMVMMLTMTLSMMMMMWVSNNVERSWHDSRARRCLWGHCFTWST